MGKNLGKLRGGGFWGGLPKGLPFLFFFSFFLFHVHVVCVAISHHKLTTYTRNGGGEGRFKNLLISATIVYWSNGPAVTDIACPKK